MDLETRAIDALRARFPGEVPAAESALGQTWVVLPRNRVQGALRLLRDEHGFNVLMDLTCVDWLGKDTPERFCMVYELFAWPANRSLRIKCWVPVGDPEIDSVSALWSSAPWAEREVWDMYGIRFRGHPDLRRLLTPMDYTGHPLRKDYPLIGHGERQNFPRFQK